MRKNLKGCKKLARETLTGNFTVPVIGSIAVAAMSVVSSYISTALFPGDSAYAIIGGEVFSFILSLVICVFSAGLYRIYLNISRREAYSFGDLLYFFSHQPDHVIVASFVVVFVHKRYGKYSGRADELGSDLYAADTSRVWAEPADSHAFHHELLYSVR